MDEIVIVTPELTPGAGGVGDYTLRLLENWERIDKLRLLVAGNESGESIADGYAVEKLAGNKKSILDQLPSRNGIVIVQYSVYGFDRLGYPGKLIQALIEWKMRAGGRLAVIFHEIWGFWPVTNRNFVVQRFHRRAMKKLVAAADMIFTTTRSQLDHLQALSRSTPMQLLPVGSNIRPVDKGMGSPRTGWAVIFGRQQNRLLALKNVQPHLSALAAAGRITRIVSMGTGSDPGMQEKERQLLAALPLSEGFEQLNAAPEERVSAILSSCTFGVFGQDELSYEKSGTFMAYAAHQLSVLAEFADPTKPEPICWLVNPEELVRGLTTAELHARAERLQNWQEKTSSWSVIAEKIGQGLGLNASKESRIQAGEN